MCFLLGLCATVCLEIFSVWVRMFDGCERNVCFVCIWLMCFSRIAIVSPLKYKSLFLLCMRYVSVAFPFIVHFVCLSHARYITRLLVIKKNSSSFQCLFWSRISLSLLCICSVCGNVCRARHCRGLETKIQVQTNKEVIIKKRLIHLLPSEDFVYTSCCIVSPLLF